MSYVLLLGAYARPAVVDARTSGVFGDAPRLLAHLDHGLDACLWLDDRLVFGEPEANRLWRHEMGRGLVTIGHSLFLGNAGCDDCGAAVPGAVCVVKIDDDDDLVLCELGSQRLTRLKPDGSRIVLARAPHPNEAVVRNRTLYFIDAADTGGGLFAVDLVDGDDAPPRQVAEFPRPEALAAASDVASFYVGVGPDVVVFDEATRSRSPCYHHHHDDDPASTRVTSIAVDADRIFVAAGPSIVALSADCQTRLGETRLATGDATSLAVATDGALYVATSDGRLLVSRP